MPIISEDSSSFMDKLKSWFRALPDSWKSLSKPYKAAFITTLLVIATIPLSVYTVFQPQENRSRAQYTSTPPDLSPTPPTGWVNASKFNNESSNNAYIQVHSATKLAVSNPFTIEAWINITKPLSGNYIRDYSLITLTKTPAYLDYGYLYRFSLETQETSGTTRPIFSALKNNQNYITVGGSSSVSIPPDKWSHIALSSFSTGDLCNLQLFIDGTQVGSTQQYTSGCNISTNNPLQLLIAKPPDGMGGISGYFYTGLVDEIRISNSIRYQSNFTPPDQPFSNDTNTLALYHFNTPPECDATTGKCYTPDSSSYGNKGEISGAVQFVPSTISPPSSVSPTTYPTIVITKVLTPTPTPTLPPQTKTLTLSISSSTDDVNQDGNILDKIYHPSHKNIWLGTGSDATSSYTGLRFQKVSIPRGAKIISAELEVYSPTTQWISMVFTLSGESIGNSLTFSNTNLPSKRLLTASKINHNSNVKWNANTRYKLGTITPVIQEIINRSDWVSGNSLSLILKGSGAKLGRKFVTSYNGSPTLAPRLIITYQ